jgi:hypothetical protein
VPPRYAYWTILIDDKPTAFRAADREDLLPTLHQLQRKNSNVVMKWFARGRVWDSPDQAQWAGKNIEREKRAGDWRPGGEHRDPRARFDKRAKQKGRERTAAPPARPFQEREDKRPRDKATGPPRRDRPWTGKPKTARPQGDPRAADPKRVAPHQRPWAAKPRAHGDRPWAAKPRAGGGQSPRGTNPRGPSPRRDQRGGDMRARDPRENERPKRRDDTPGPPPPPEQIVTKPKPPERG